MFPTHPQMALRYTPLTSVDICLTVVAFKVTSRHLDGGLCRVYELSLRWTGVMKDGGEVPLCIFGACGNWCP